MPGIGLALERTDGDAARMTKRLMLALTLFLLTLPAQAAQCGGDFRTFLGAMAADARAAGISQRTIETAFAGVSPDPAVLAFDRRQHGTFRMDFERYAST